MESKVYKRYAKARAKKSPLIKNCVCAFLIGGLICTAGQALLNFYKYLGITEDNAGTLTSVTLIFITALLTGFGVFDNISKHAGGGTLVPITGFANAVVSPALEFKSEGSILGTGVKLFSIAGPVIVYGTAASVVYGIIYYIVKLVCDV